MLSNIGSGNGLVLSGTKPSPEPMLTKVTRPRWVDSGIWSIFSTAPAVFIITQNHIAVDPDSKVHGAIMGPIWGRQDPGGPHVVPMNFAIWGLLKDAMSIGNSIDMSEIHTF